MNTLSLNCRGLGSPDSRRALRSLIWREAPALVFLCDTKLGGRDMRRIIDEIDGFDGLDVAGIGRLGGLGGLGFLWQQDIDRNFVSSSAHHMDFLIKGVDGEWRVTGFYRWRVVSDRHLSWELLRDLSRQSTVPWLCIGDFHEILFYIAMQRGNRQQWQMANFRVAFQACSPRDVPCVC